VCEKRVNRRAGILVSRFESMNRTRATRRHATTPRLRVSCSRGRRAAVLVLVLVVFAALSLLCVGLCQRVHLEMKRDRMQAAELRAYYLALGGIHRALAALAAPGNDTESVDYFGSPWHLHTTARAEGFFAGQTQVGWLSRARLSYAVTDEEGRLNINTSSPVGWVHLPGMTEPIIYAILDWQDADDRPLPHGAESAYYLRLPLPYRAKDGPMRMIWELALVKDVTWSLFRGEDANGDGLLTEPNEDDGPKLQPMDNADGRLDHGLMDFFTVYGNGKVNLNTAGVEVLSSLPGINPETAQAVVAWRSGPDGQPGTPDDTYLGSLEQLAVLPGLTPYQVELLTQYGTLHSTHFRIVSEARVGRSGTTCRLWATARRDKGRVELVLVKKDS